LGDDGNGAGGGGWIAISNPLMPRTFSDAEERYGKERLVG